MKTEEPHITCCLRAPERGSRTFFKLTRGVHAGEVSDSQPSISQMFARFVKTDETFKKILKSSVMNINELMVNLVVYNEWCR